MKHLGGGASPESCLILDERQSALTSGIPGTAADVRWDPLFGCRETANKLSRWRQRSSRMNCSCASLGIPPISEQSSTIDSQILSALLQRGTFRQSVAVRAMEFSR